MPRQNKPPNPLVVDDLVCRAMALFELSGASAAEMLSAAFTLNLRLIQGASAITPEVLPMLRQAAESLLLACADDRKTN